MRRLALSLAVAVLSLFATSCTKVDTAPGAGARQPYTHPHELRFASAADIQHLNPILGISQYEAYLAALTMAWLIRTDAKGDATVPELITVIPSQKNGGISADGKTITWHLRHGVKWSDGAPFTADDVVYTTKQVLNPANNAISTDGWDQITKIDEPDKYTVVYHLKAPYSSFAVTFFSTGGANPSVLPQHLLKRYHDLNQVPYNSLPVGIGPFKYEAWNHGDSIVMVANDRYFRGRPKLDRVIYKTVQDRNTVLEQLRTHELDLWDPLSPHYYPEVSAIPDITMSKTPSFTFDHLDFNLRTPALKDVRVRQALRLAIDRAQINAKVQNGLYILNESPVSPASKYYLALPRVPYDIAKANAVLDAAGWKRGAGGIRSKGGRRLSLVFAVAAGIPDTDTEIELIRTSWNQLGVDFIVKRYLAAQFFAPASGGGIIYGGKFDVVLFGWGSDPNEDMSNLYACYRFPPNGQNDMHWCDRAATAAMDAAKTSYDPAVRKKYIDVVQRRVYADVPTVVITTRRELAGYNSDLKNWHPNPIEPFDDMMKVDI
jgi:peptide/nickel transport system substrate-binding protein